MNNKGFAITTILYGTLILFLLLFVSLLGILTQYKSNLEMLIESNNGTRDIVTMKKGDIVIDSGEKADVRGYYSINNGQCYKYLVMGETANCD